MRVQGSDYGGTRHPADLVPDGGACPRRASGGGSHSRSVFAAHPCTCSHVHFAQAQVTPTCTNCAVQALLLAAVFLVALWYASTAGVEGGGRRTIDGASGRLLRGRLRLRMLSLGGSGVGVSGARSTPPDTPVRAVYGARHVATIGSSSCMSLLILVEHALCCVMHVFMAHWRRNDGGLLRLLTKRFPASPMLRKCSAGSTTPGNGGDAPRFLCRESYGEWTAAGEAAPVHGAALRGLWRPLQPGVPAGLSRGEWY